MNSLEKKTGFVLGKFMPPHNGHVYLFEFARHYVDELVIVVETARNQPIPGELRFQWVREMFPDVQVLHLTDENPQEPSEHPEFWSIWENSLRRVLPFEPDFLFASEQYGWKLAEVMKAQFVPVDLERTAIPISGTAIRKDPQKYWDYLPRITRPWFTKRVCIFGPESTGKSTLTRRLAKHFETVWVPEYARTHIESRGGDISLDDIPMIARGQMAAEDALAFDSQGFLFCDTDLVTTTIWSNWLFGECPDWIEREAAARSYDLYLLTDVDVPWVDDAIRYLPKERQTFFDKCVSELKQRDRPFVVIRGDWEQRLEVAIEAVEAVEAVDRGDWSFQHGDRKA